MYIPYRTLNPNILSNSLSSSLSLFTLDTMLEQALHKVALKPLYSHLYEYMKISREKDGSLQKLQTNQNMLMSKSLEELEGTAGAGVPDAAMLEKIQQRWATMHQQYSPQKKVEMLLKVCKNIYHSMTVNAKPGECSRTASEIKLS